MKILVRADASSEIGTGHIVRTKTLARVLRDRGADVSFVCRPHEGNMIDILEADGFRVHTLPAIHSDFSPLKAYDRWIGGTQDEDAQQTMDVTGHQPFDWVIVDHYGLGAPWESTLRSVARRVMSIDDLANREHDCDLLLDQNYASAPWQRYKQLVPAMCSCLMGPEFALLKPEYAEVRKSMPVRDGGVQRVMVFFGGGDTHRANELAMSALSKTELEHIDVDLVIGATTKPDPYLDGWNRKGKTIIHRNLPHLANVMAQADFAIGAGGATSWERMCMGLPSIVISVAENQEPACSVLAKDGLAWYLGQIQNVRVDTLAKNVCCLVDDPGTVRASSQRGMQLVDGLGAARVAEKVETKN